MSQITSGLRKILNKPFIYDCLQNIMGAHSFRKEFVSHYINNQSHIRVLDIGCGTARILDYLDNVEYVGFDLSQRYINNAKHRFQEKGTFHCSLVTEAKYC